MQDPQRVDTSSLEALVAAAQEARVHAYAPYSHFAVGAAVLAGGLTFTGVNVENAAYPIGVCAERVAVGAAITAGQRSIDAIAVAGSSQVATPPCGGCRQFLSEFGMDMTVVAESPEGERRQWTLSELLPEVFDRSFLSE